MNTLAFALSICVFFTSSLRAQAIERAPITDTELSPAGMLACNAEGIWQREADAWRLFARTPFRAIRFARAKRGDLYVVGGDPAVSGRLAHFDAEGQLLATHEYAHDLLYDIDLDPTQSILAIAAADGRVLRIDLPHLEQLTLLARHGAAARAVRFAPQTKHLASAGLDGRVLLFELGTVEPPRDIHDHLVGVECLAFSPDGKQLASGARDGRVRIHDLQGRALLFADPLPSAISVLRFDAEQKLTAGTARGSVHVLDRASSSWSTVEDELDHPIRWLRPSSKQR